jgi:gas vesicle protein
LFERFAFKRRRRSEKCKKPKKGVMIMKELITNKRYSIVVPFLVGGVVGAGLSLLLTPKSGKEVREDLKRLANNSRDRVSMAIDKGKGFYNDTRERVSMAIDKGKGLYDDSIARVSVAIDKGRELYDGGISTVEKAIEAGKTAFVQEKEKWQHT